MARVDQPRAIHVSFHSVSTELVPIFDTLVFQLFQTFFPLPYCSLLLEFRETVNSERGD